MIFSIKERSWESIYSFKRNKVFPSHHVRNGYFFSFTKISVDIRIWNNTNDGNQTRIMEKSHYRKSMDVLPETPHRENAGRYILVRRTPDKDGDRLGRSTAIIYTINFGNLNKVSQKYVGYQSRIWSISNFRKINRKCINSLRGYSTTKEVHSVNKTRKVCSE